MRQQKAEQGARWLEAFKRDPAALMQGARMTPDPWQAEMLRGDTQRLLLLCSRQAGKSTVTAALALHEALREPEGLILLLSRAQRQSAELLRKVMQFFRALGRPAVTEHEGVLAVELDNGSRIISLPGKEETIRSYSGVRLLVIDEAARVPDSLYNSVRPMLAVSGGKLACLSTPFGKRGFFYEAWSNGNPSWKRIKVTAHECPRITPEFLEEEQREIGDWWFRQEYLCEFNETIDAVFTHAQVMRALSDEVEEL